MVFSKVNESAIAMIICGLVTFIATTFIAPKYGRYNEHAKLFSWTGVWGFTLDAKFGWILMECPGVVVPVMLAVFHGANGSPVNILLILLYLGHYLNRSILYPLKVILSVL